MKSKIYATSMIGLVVLSLGYIVYLVINHDLENMKRFHGKNTFVCYDSWGQETMNMKDVTVEKENNKWIVWIHPPKFSRGGTVSKLEIAAVDCEVK